MPALPSTPGTKKPSATVDTTVTDESQVEETNVQMKRYQRLMDEEFGKVEHRAILNYRINLWINVAIVALGVALILASLYRALISGVDLSTALGSAIGVTDLVTIFLVNPQDKIRRALADFAQMQIIYSTWSTQTAAAYYAWAEGGYAETGNFETKLTTYANQAVTAIENNIGAG